MKYSIGDKVRIKSIEWYNQNKNQDGDVVFKTKDDLDWIFTKNDAILCGKVMTISDIQDDGYFFEECNNEFLYCDEMIEGLVDLDYEIKNFNEIDRACAKLLANEYQEDLSFVNGFTKGAEWNYNKIMKKAINWINETFINNMDNCGHQVVSSFFDMTIEELIEDFKETMEE